MKKISSILSLVLLSTSCSLSNNEKYHSLSIPISMQIENFIELVPGETDQSLADNFNTEEYKRIYENSFKDVLQNPVSTFSIDVDNAAYSNIRRYLSSNVQVPKDVVRIEEMINYFSYSYPQPTGTYPFSIYTEIADCPWSSESKLLHVGIQGKSIDYENQKASNLVFLVDVSGSMSSANKLPLLKKSFALMLDGLRENDRVAVVAYAGAAGLVLPSTLVKDKETILKALKKLSSGGSTAGGEGIELAYEIARENLLTDGNNRVILATDGDFNIGTSATGDLVRMIEERRKENIYLTICGFGMGNYKDGRMEEISNAGNGNYFYIDNILEAKKVFVKELKANLFTIAKDVKSQIEFNPNSISAYRLIGYENRLLAKEDFNNDKKDAGELGAGHSVTALYEVIFRGSSQQEGIQSDLLKYQESQLTSLAQGDELLTIKLRYKPIDKEESVLIERAITKAVISESPSNDFVFSAAVAGFGLLLRDSNYKGDLSYKKVMQMVKKSTLDDEAGYRHEFMTLVEKADLMSAEN